MLTGVLIVNSVMHAFIAISSYALAQIDEQADAANMLFLGMFIADKERLKVDTGGLGFSRILVAVVAKIPAIWVKTSLFAITYDFICAKQKMATVMAVGLAWYTIVPAIVPTATLLLPLTSGS